MKLDITKQLQTRSERVKGIDIHPTEPWILTTLYSGKVQIYNYETGALVKSLDVCDLPIRAGRFVARKNWIVVGSDDFMVRVFNYNTLEKVTQFEGHPDYIRAIIVHPTESLILTAGDDMTIRLWNWEQNWKCQQIFEGHQHFVLYIAWNPKDLNTFASCSLDRTVKVWSLGSPKAHYTLEGHQAVVNHVEYYPASDKPYLITSSDDRTVRIWDYQTKACVAVLEGHANNVSFALFHPLRPVIISGSEDSTIKVWNANTYKLEQTINFGLERAWCIAARKSASLMAIGFDAGAVTLKIGKDEPAISMDSSGKLICCKNSEVFGGVIKGAATAADGEIVPMQLKELGALEVFPDQLVHSPNGRFVAVAGDGDYIIYTALAWRNKSFGSGLDFCWAADSSEYAVRESATTVKVFRNFKEKATIDVGFNATKIYGGRLLAARGEDSVKFYDWETLQVVARVNVENCNKVIWSDSNDLVAIICDDATYILRYVPQEGEGDPEDGHPDAFGTVSDVQERLRNGCWIGDCFIYVSATRLNYMVGEQTFTIAHFDTDMYLLGYIQRDGRIYLADKDVNIVSYYLNMSVILYQTLVLRGDLEIAQEQVLPKIPKSDLVKVARFLDNEGHKAVALEITPDNEQKFELAVELNKLDIALDIAREDSTASLQKWKSLGDQSLKNWNISMAEECFKNSDDLESLFLIYTSTNNKEQLKLLADKAKESSRLNLAFNSYWYIGDVDACVELLGGSQRYAEASLFALTYGGKVEPQVKAWKETLVKSGKKRIAKSICDPAENPDKFPSNLGEKVVKAAADGGDLIDLDIAVEDAELVQNGHHDEALDPEEAVEEEGAEVAENEVAEDGEVEAEE